MLPVLFPALLIGCLHRAPAPVATASPGLAPASPTAVAPASPAPTPDPCSATLDHGADLYNAGKADPAVKVWTEGYAKCGAGHSFLAHEGVAAAKAQHFDDAAKLAMQELSEPGPDPLALKLLVALRGSVSPEIIVAEQGMGRSAAAPIMTPDVGGEYAWIRYLTCGGKESALKQSLVSGPAGMLDEMQFVCPGQTTPQTLYFDFSADPTEKALEQEMNAVEAGAGSGTPSPDAPPPASPPATTPPTPAPK